MKPERVIDADGHVMETGVDWAQYLEEPYRARAPRGVRDEEGRMRLLMEGKLHARPRGRGRGVGGPFRRYPSRREGMYNPEERLKDMDVEGIDVAVLFGTQVALSAAGLEDDGFAVAMCRAYNNWLRDFCAAAPDRLRGVAIVPLQDVTAAVEELRRAVTQLGMVGLCMPTRCRDRNLDHPAYYPLYEEAQRLDVPIAVHTAPGHHGVEAAGIERFDNFFYTHSIAFPFEEMIGTMLVACGGVLERFPRLRWAFLEAGVGWVPYWLERLDEHYERLAGHVPNCSRPPSELLASAQCFYACEPDEQMLPYVVERLGAERIVYASDYAHWDSSYPDSVRLIAEREDLSADAKRKILLENAARLYQLLVAATV